MTDGKTLAERLREEALMRDEKDTLLAVHVAGCSMLKDFVGAMWFEANATIYDATVAKISALESSWQSQRALLSRVLVALEPFVALARDIDGDAFGSALENESALLTIASSYEAPIGNPSVGDLRRASALAQEIEKEIGK